MMMPMYDPIRIPRNPEVCPSHFAMTALGISTRTSPPRVKPSSRRTQTVLKR